MSKPVKQIHLAAHFPGVNNTTVWSDPGLGQPHRVRFVRALRADRRARQVRLPVPRRRACACASRAGEIYDLDVVGRPDTFTVLAALAAVTERLGPDRHHQLHVQRTLRGGTAVRLARPSVRGPGRLERRHLLGCLHRRELPPRRLPRRGPALRARERASSTAPTTLFDSWRGDEIVADKERGVFLSDPDAGAFAYPGRALRHQRPVQRAAQPAGQAGDLPGRRLRPRPRVRRRRRRCDLLPARHAGGRPGVLRRREGPAGPLRAAATTSCSSCPRRRSCSATPTPRRPDIARRGAPGSGLAGRPRSSSSSSCGTATCPTTTRTARCPSVDPIVGENTIARGPGQRADVPRPDRDRQRVAGQGRGREPHAPASSSSR